MIRFQSFEQFHNKKNVGSTRIRVHQLIERWPEAGLYQYGEKPDVLIFQKVYCTQDHKFPRFYDGGIKILDICDPDWIDGVLIKETVAAMDGVVCPTEPLKEFLSQLTDAPVKVIKDRFNLNEFPPPKTHTGKLQSLVWFGYSHNTEALRLALPSIKSRGLKLTVISDQDPQFQNDLGDLYNFRKYKQENLYKQIQESDVAIFPMGTRPQDKYKSENKTVISQLCGVPVVRFADRREGLQDYAVLDELETAESRNKYVKDHYGKVRREYNVDKSVKEYKDFIQLIKAKKDAN